MDSTAPQYSKLLFTHYCQAKTPWVLVGGKNRTRRPAHVLPKDPNLSFRLSTWLHLSNWQGLQAFHGTPEQPCKCLAATGSLRCGHSWETGWCWTHRRSPGEPVVGQRRPFTLMASSRGHEGALKPFPGNVQWMDEYWFKDWCFHVSVWQCCVVSVFRAVIFY